MPEPAAATALERVVAFVGKLAALLILPSLAIILFEIVMRFVFGAPTLWVSESSQFLFGFAFLLGGAFTLAQGGHVRVDVVLHALPSRARLWSELFAYPFIFFYLGLMLWVSGVRAIEAIKALERTDSAWQPYVFPLYAAVPLAVLLMLAQAALLFARDVQRARRG